MQTKKLKREVCPVCRSATSSFKFKGYDILYMVTKKSFSIYECSTCKALFLSPFPTTKETYAFYPKTYYSYNTDENKGFFTNVKSLIIRSKMEPQTRNNFLEKILIVVFKNKFSGVPLYKKRGGKFLDIGCGPGSNLKLLQKYGWDTYGIELDENVARQAKKQGLKISQTSLEQADFGGVTFDSIRMWHVLEHITNPHIAMKKLYKLLKPKGEILLAVPNTDSLVRHLFGTYWYGLDVPRHVINYSPKTLEYLLGEHHFKIMEIKYASVGAYIASFSHILRKHFKYKGNLINNLFLVFLTSPLDFISDLLGKGDTIFLKIQKQ